MQTPIKLSVGTPFYVELSVNKMMLHDGDNKAKIIVESCVVYPFNSTSNPRYSLIHERIAVDDGTLILRSPQLNLVRFKTHMVNIGLEDHELYLNCNTNLCPSSDKSSV